VVYPRPFSLCVVSFVYDPYSIPPIRTFHLTTPPPYFFRRRAGRFADVFLPFVLFGQVGPSVVTFDGFLLDLLCDPSPLSLLFFFPLFVFEIDGST